MNRVLLKTSTYCVMHLVVAVAVAFALTRNWHAALAIGLVEPFVQTFAFALHEKFWAKRGVPQTEKTSGGCSHIRLWPKSQPKAAEAEAAAVQATA
ncbi:DUF2061 domain-containing protein [Phenylobacterium deserti]|uniref:DUF2061 domain-containing protein n=1 Tax=Phenylobacterium deserti TaxID=1914756 RepID=A0A328ADT9_9CAUL|nr:DUF2061 domain-containing protein [Phenylobacterium deserti]RAK50908.1 DUF2061 domain-containing protein [Phenylobacterium deserti]